MDEVFKQKYQKYKYRVKLWENDFKKKYGRVPSKYDIRDAAQEIRDSYRMYYKLKTSFLEDTLNDVLADDGFDVLEMSQATMGDSTLNDSLCESINGGPQLPLDISGIVDSVNAAASSSRISSAPFSNLQELPQPSALTNLANMHENHVIKNFEAVEVSKLNEKAWGTDVSKKPITDTSSNIEKKAFKSNLNQKLFKASSSFSMRNPRKSLSRSTLDGSLRGGSSQQSLSDNLAAAREVLPDLETILLQKAKEQQAAAAAIVANPLLASDKTKDTLKPLKSHVDEGWLDRTAAQNGIITEPMSSRKTDLDSSARASTSARKPSYGLSNLDVSKIIPAKIETAVVIEKNENIALEPKMPEVEPPQIENNFVEMLEKKENNKIRKPLPKPASSDSSDAVVSDSEGEEEPQAYRHIVKRRRVLAAAAVDQTQATAIENIILSANDNHKANSNSENLETIEASDNPCTKELDDGKDFSVDEEEDADYVPDEKPAKGQRKKAIAKRSKPLVKKEKNSSPKEKKVPKEKKARVAKPAANKPTTTRRTRKTNDSEALDNEETEPEEKPLDPENLKYALALERADISCVPRANLSELESADKVAQRYINTVASLSTIAPKKPMPNVVINEKRNEARKKLEEKIASGKLNENFVTINIQKKTFVRGKKSVNYSKYKKKQWKHKKHIAALTGPDMDMGGCDGGVLKCFTCGQVGHFAQNCKIKGDALLPLTAQLEEDPSPFPTLEEAERMASQSALAVHSRNIAKMPQASNAAILYGGNKESEESDGHEDAAESSNDDSSDVDEDKEEDGDEYNEIFIETDDELEGMDLDAAVEMEVEKDAAPVVSPIKQYVGHKIPAEFLKKAGLDSNETGVSTTQFSGVGALYDLNADGTAQDVTPEVLEALRLFGHTSFRKGQDRAIMRILSGLSTLVTLSTGSGKSLCYQLPAYLYSRQKKSITLVISPLVSLMEDQVTGVPHFLRAHCLHTNQTPQQRVKILQMISDGEIDILLVSPEAVVAGERSTGFGSILRQLPPIAFACIDEAHCVSQWSHNFRPSYLMICKVLKKNLGVRTVLGLTATATLPTRLSIINHLGITDGERGIISDIPLPDNLVLSVSKDENRDAALMQLLNSKRFDACQSIIIYCTRRDECERIAGFIRTCMQDRKIAEPEGGKKKRKRVNWHAEPYHAGMPSSRRRTIQNAFMKNELRIVVATIAFGMGINKPDIRAVLHYNMPRNFESYVQEVGRAGRDGKPSHCHLFLTANASDQNELRRHIYANSIDRHVIRKLLQRIFVSCSCDKNLKESSSSKSKMSQDRPVEKLEMDASDFGSAGAVARQHICPGHEIGFSIEKTVEALDIPEENISTLLCYMELDTRWGIKVLSSAYINAKVISYGGPKYLKHAAKDCPPLAMAIALNIKNNTFKEDTNIIEFSVVDIAAAIGWNSGVVKYQLKNLEWIQLNGYPKRSPISVSFSDLGLRIKAPGDFTADEIDDALDTLYNRTVKQEQTQLIQLQYVFQGLSSVAYNSCAPCTSDNFATDRSDQLKAIIRDYFRNDYPKDLKLEIDTTSVPDDYIISDVHALVNMYPDNNFSGRNVARIFHGISSPNYPAVMWGRCKYWRAHSKTDFNRIVKLANTVIVQRRT